MIYRHLALVERATPERAARAVLDGVARGLHFVPAAPSLAAFGAARALRRSRADRTGPGGVESGPA